MTAIKVAIAIGLVLAYLYAAMFTHWLDDGPEIGQTKEYIFPRKPAQIMFEDNGAWWWTGTDGVSRGPYSDIEAAGKELDEYAKNIKVEVYRGP